MTGLPAVGEVQKLVLYDSVSCLGIPSIGLAVGVGSCSVIFCTLC